MSLQSFAVSGPVTPQMTPGVVMALLATTPQVCPPVALSQVSQISRVGMRVSIRKETTYTWSLAGMSQSFCFEPRLGTHRLQTQLQSFPIDRDQTATVKTRWPKESCTFPAEIHWLLHVSAVPLRFW